ncbi:MAG: carbon-nitrogen hydrolase family protein, partial [Bauldia litoralis]
MTFKAACVQLTAGREFAPNIETASRFIRRAAEEGADFVALPENCTMIEPVAAAAVRKAQPEESHPGLAAFREVAAEAGVWLLVGSLSIKLPSGKIANRSLLIGADGAVAARYDKLHLFDVNLRDDEWYRESDTIEPGAEAVSAETPWGTLGMTVCYDLRFPYLYRSLAQAGASFLTVPSAFTVTTGKAHWHVLLRARAIETGCYVIAPAQWGEHAEGRRTYGHSLIVAPWGEVLADGGEGEGLTFAEIDPAEVDKARRRVPSLTHDRDFATPRT